MDPSILTFVTQGGLAAVGVFGLYHGYSLYSKQICKESPKDEIELKAYNSNYQAIKLFLLTSMIVTFLTGGIEIIKLFHNSKSNIVIKISPYEQVFDNLKPSINLKNKPLGVAKIGTVEAQVENKDAIYIEIGPMFDQLQTYIKNLEFANMQIKELSKKNGNGQAEVGADDPN